jgi:hypothetical protein
MLSIRKTLMYSAWQIALAGTFLTNYPSAAQAQAAPPAYTNASLSGTFILSELGTSQPSQAPYAVVATLTMDGAGNVTGTEDLVAGAFSQMGNLVGGTYSINPAGWGALALAITYSDGSGTVINANYQTLMTSQGLVLNRIDNGVFAQSTLLPQAQSAVSNPNVSGAFVMQEHGYLASGSFYLVGALNLDGQGGVTGTATYQSLGTSYTAAVSGIYSINAGGTESMVLTLTVTNPDGTTSSENFSYCLSIANAAGTAAGINSDSGTTSVVLINSR